MSKKATIRLVIDADVARSAGPEHATHPTSKQCRDFLSAIEKYDLRIILTPELQEEWNKHQSGFFLSWRSRMMGRKRIELSSSNQDDELRASIVTCIESTLKRDAMLKDCHLLEAAILSDKRIVSRDDTVRGYFSAACLRIKKIREILWINPTNEEETAIKWLERRAPADNHRRLKNYASKPAS